MRQYFYPRRLAAIGALLLAGFGAAAQQAPLDYVNPFIGTGAEGNAYPGAQAPFGMISVSPNTTFENYDDAGARSGYKYAQTKIRGFGLTHFSGVGCHAMQDLLFMPVVGALAASPVGHREAYVSTFSHAQERATPGFYQVALPDQHVSLRVAARPRAALGELRFEGPALASFVFEPTNSANGISAGQLRIDAARRTLSGRITTGGFCWRDPAYLPYTVYFVVEFDAPITAHGVWQGDRKRPDADTVSGKDFGAYVTFGRRKGRPVRMKAAISFVSVENARLNARTEIPGWDFNATLRRTQAEWARRLGQLTVAGGTPDERASFYTAVYHNLLQPNVFEDVNGEYQGFDFQPHRIEKGHSKYVNFSLWDTYRTTAHLQALLAPHEASDMVRSLLLDAQQGGAFPNWSMNNREYGVMNGYSPFPFIANLYAMGATDFDVGAVKEMMKKVSTEYHGCQGRHGWLNLDDYQRLGYVPVDKNDLGTSMTLEYGIDDYSIAKLCEAAGDAPGAAFYRRRSQNVFSLFNPQTGFLQSKKADGSFLAPFDSTTTKGYNEGNATQYFWSVPHSFPRLVALAGGRAAVEKRLDRFLLTIATGWAPEKPRYWLGNEPCFGAVYAYNYLQAPWKAQYHTRRIAHDYFKNTPDGLPGDDDGGAMSALYVFSAIGLYPYLPGESGFTVTGPLFEKVTLRRPSGQPFVINAKGATAGAPYIQRLRVNGKPSSSLWLDWAALSGGGVLDFEMGATANKSWGAAPQDAPPSYAEVP